MSLARRRLVAQPGGLMLDFALHLVTPCYAVTCQIHARAKFMHLIAECTRRVERVEESLWSLLSVSLRHDSEENW